jgi:hypothetical protein
MYYMDKKILTVFAVGFLLLLIGCIGEELTAEQIRDRSLEAMDKVETYAFNMDIDMVMKGGGVNVVDVKEMTMNMKGDGKVDQTNKRMQMEMTMSMSGMTMEMEQYVIGDTQYMKVPMVGWVKNRSSAEIWETGDYARAQNELIKGMEVKLLEDEEVDGVDCYVLEIEVEDIEEMFEIMIQQMGSATSLSADELESIKGMAFKEWIAKDTYFVTKMFMNLQMEEEGTMVDMSMTMKFYDYNEPMEITLPEEAEDAIDMESMMGGILPTP